MLIETQNNKERPGPGEWDNPPECEFREGQP